jgi:hypothetical protein
MNPVVNAINGINQYTMDAIITPSHLAVAEKSLQPSDMQRTLETLILNSDLKRYYLFILDIIPPITYGDGVGLTNIIIHIIGPFVIPNMTPFRVVVPNGSLTIPMSGMVFNYMGKDYSNNLSWCANNYLQFSGGDDLFILLGGAIRRLKSLSYSNETKYRYSITTLLVTFYNSYADPNSGITNTYQYKIRLIKENTRQQRQFIEVYIISSPPIIGNFDVWKKSSQYGYTQLGLCGDSFSPVANTSFVFESDSTGTTWKFTENAHVNV